MEFSIIAELFEKLEKTNKRIFKILLLRDFLVKYPKEGPVIFDIISGNFQRKISKKKLAISVKTFFSVFSFISQKNKDEIEKEFNKIGDLGKLAEQIIDVNKQKSLNYNKLTFGRIKKSFLDISNVTGKNSTKFKKEILTNLFLSTNSSIENKFLVRFMIEDLRIGVNEGVLKEAMVNAYFPKIIETHKICSNCGYINLNLKKCFKCGYDIKKEKEIQIELAKKKYEIIELNTPKNIKGLDKYDINYKINPIEYALRRDKDKYFLNSENSREVYKIFLNVFEKKYNLINSFVTIYKELEEDFNNINKFEIKVGIPIKSMLGTSLKTIDENFKTTSRPALIDFKYDGLRIQIHNNKGNVNLFTRNLDEITDQFPEVVRFVKDNFSDISFILDSECVGFDYFNYKFLPFQILSKRILTKEYNGVKHINVVLKVFDILYFNGKTLIDMDYNKRRDILENLMLNRKIRQKLYFNIEKILKK